MFSLFVKKDAIVVCVVDNSVKKNSVIKSSGCVTLLEEAGAVYQEDDPMIG